MGIGRKRNILRNWKKRTSNHLIINRDISTKELIQADPRSYVARAYRDWYMTQTSTVEEVNKQGRYTEHRGISWLLDVPE